MIKQKRRKPKKRSNKTNSYVEKQVDCRQLYHPSLKENILSLSSSHMMRGVNPGTNASYPNIHVNRRFQTTTTVSANVAIQSINDQFMFAGTTILAFPQFVAWRIKRIKIWASCTSTTEGRCELTPTLNAGISDNIAPQAMIQTIRAQTTTIDEPAHINYKCSKSFPIGCWHNTSTTNLSAILFNILCTDPGLVEIDFEGIPPYLTSTLGYQRAIVAGTPGNFYAAPTIVGGLATLDVNTI